MTYPYIHTGNTISILIEGKQHVIQKTHPNFSRVSEAIRTKNWEAIPLLVDLPKMIDVTSKGVVTVKDGQVMYQGKVIHGSLSTRILRLFAEGFDITPFTNFMANLMQNPSETAINELYDFLEACTLPITEDGHFLAYKKVRPNLKDFYTGKFDHSIGTVLEMDRAKVDSDRHRTCSNGFHFCSFSYLPHYESNQRYRVMVVKVNPKDVVAIPSDYNNAKGRACRYVVVDEHEGGIEEEGLKNACYSYDTDKVDKVEEPTPSVAKATPQRDSKGRFIKKTAQPAGPLRDSKGRFVKRR
jgi:hypothetical protein